MNARRCSDLIDKKATRIASGALAGTVDETDARWELVVLVQKAGVAQEVAGRRRRDPQMTIDLADRLEQLLQRKVLSDAPNALQLSRIAQGASLTGWSRCLAARAVPSELRNLQRPREVLSAIPERSRTRDDPQELDPRERSRSEAAITDHFRRLRSSRGPEAVVYEQARTLTRWYELPPLDELDPDTREELRARIQGEPRAVYDGLHRVAAGEALDPVLAAPFSGWPPEALDVVLGLGPTTGSRVASTLAMSAATPRPPRPNRVRAQFQELVRARSSDPKWQWTAQSLAASFLRVVTDLQPDGPRRQPVPKPQTLRDREQAQFDRNVQYALVAPGQPVGDTPEAITATLRDLLADSEHAAA